MGVIRYVTGDATTPRCNPAIIVHICNDNNIFGAGFALALANRYPHVKRAYHTMEKMCLGEVQYVMAEKGVIIANMIAQKDVKAIGHVPPIRYVALDQCLYKVAERILHSKPSPSVHCPRIGCGLAGGTWDKVEPLIIKNMASKDIDVFVYDLKNQS